jgi:hypothetical protein
MIIDIVIRTITNPILELQRKKNINPIVFEERKLKYNAAYIITYHSKKNSSNLA